MQILEKILLATDFTESNENAIESAIVLAKTFQSKIILLHVLPKNVGNNKAKKLLDHAAQKQFEKIVKRMHKAGVETGEPILEYGDHLDRIILTSERIDANMILVGAGEIEKKQSIRLGTTAEKIVEKSDKPVMVIQSGKYLDIKKIICPIDFSDESKRAVKNAIILAHRFNAELTVLSVFEPVYRGPLNIEIEWGDQDGEILKQHKTSFDAFIEDLNFSGLNYKTVVKKGDFAKIILDTIGHEHMDLMVIGATGRKGIGRFFTGSVTEKVIREVPCSFVTIKMENFIELKLTAHIQDIETHFKNAKQLVKDGMFESAINEYKVCLNINEMHIPSLNGLATVYDILDMQAKAEKYRQLSKNVQARMWDRKIEAEARKFYRK